MLEKDNKILSSYIKIVLYTKYNQFSKYFMYYLIQNIFIFISLNYYRSQGRLFSGYWLDSFNGTGHFKAQSIC